MDLHLGGHLGWYDPQNRSRLVIPLTEPILLSALLERLAIPSAEIAVATVNRKPIELEAAEVSDGDAFSWNGGGTGVLLIHCYTATTVEVRWLGKYLHEHVLNCLQTKHRQLKKT